MKTRFSPQNVMRALVGAALLLPSLLVAANYQVIGWNEFGNDRMDSDYSVFSLWPPGNTIHAQVVYQGKRLTNATGITVTYQAVADPDGSINSTSQGKSDFWLFAGTLFGTNLMADMGMSGYGMPGMANMPQAMTFNSTNARFSALDIPITPNDDALQKKYYPMMRLIAKTNATPFATNDIVLAISDEVNCAVCHASGSPTTAQPTNGWVWNTNPEHDYRLNILRKHDELKDPATYPGILSSNGYNPAGLFRTVAADGMPVRCTQCHKSTTVPGSGFGTIKALTAAIHSHHSSVIDPDTGVAMDSTLDRSTCYHCHSGPHTKALRGVMGDSVSTNGVRQIQCQSCHGQMSLVGATNRTGWIDLPDCQSCHVGRATNAVIRYTTVFTSPGVVRQSTDPLFATITNAAFGNYSLYRYSTNHGKLFCEACHGSPHAEFPADRNDNIRVSQVNTNQSNIGMLSDCHACHNTIPSGTGPHGAHEFGQNWVNGSVNHIGNSGAACNACHGSDERGTILSLSRSDQTITSSQYGNKKLWRGFRVGCYLCHRGNGSLTAAFGPAVVSNVSTNTSNDAPVTMRLPAVDTNSAVQSISLRVISQPVHGTVGVTNTSSTNWFATYYPEPGFVGTETFTFSAWNGASDSNLGTGTVAVAQGGFSITATPMVPPGFPRSWPVPFCVTAKLNNVATNLTYDWNFGDASPHNTNQYVNHVYSTVGTYNWQVISTVQSSPTKSATNSGSILIGGPAGLTAIQSGGSIVISWPTPPEAVLEQSLLVGAGASWTVCTNIPVLSGGRFSVNVPAQGTKKFYRLRQL